MSERQGLWTRYRLRLKRKRLLWRAFRKRREISRVSHKIASAPHGGILVFATMRNEMLRLPSFLAHYRRLGAGHFLIVDNASEDGTDAFLAAQPDVSVWRATSSYKASRFGTDWLTCLLWRYGHGHWTLTVDADELFIYPEWERCDLPALTAALSRAGLATMGAVMLDLYPKGPVGDPDYEAGQHPTEVLRWFDAYGYRVQKQTPLGNLWLQGGPRARRFFADDPARAPTLNKIPLIRWDRSYVYVNSTHSALPARLNRVYDEAGVEAPWGALLHTKFLPDAGDRARTEKMRGEHFGDAMRFADYYDGLAANPDFWTPESLRFEGAAQLERLGLISRGALILD